ncbi:alpha/beta hydrolase family protein [Thermus tenuipuniceus]|uniref:alpha/beta hydrolase family protein n=1 Tax=Thermus tenuipuniceus TaxID=2078690 RepID=UPI001FCA1E51|nr:dipeptidyl aminopeptidase [Thermus tenuipuniceus]
MRVLAAWFVVLVLGLFWGLRSASPGLLKRVEGGVVHGWDGVTLFTQVCPPQGTTDRGVILVPGGFGPPTADTEKRCRLYAEKGVVALVPHLRGRGKSGGKPTGCLKEAEDLALLARFLPRLGVRYHAYAGYSLGACVALKAAALEGRARSVAFVIGPVDFAEQVEILRRTRPDALARWREVFGGLPEDCPDCYDRQSPLPYAARLKAPLLILHAGNDPLIPPTQACRLRDVREAAGRKVHQVALTREGKPWVQPLTKGRACLRPTGFGPLGEDHLILFPDLHHAVTPAMEAWVERFVLCSLRVQRGDGLGQLPLKEGVLGSPPLPCGREAPPEGP